MSDCISFTHISVLVNGKANDFFGMSRRFFDSLLFTIISEAFSGIIEKANVAGLLYGFTIGRDGPQVTHL